MKKIPFSAERVCVCSRRVQTRAVSLRTEIRFFRLRSQFTVWVRAGGGGAAGVPRRWLVPQTGLPVLPVLPASGRYVKGERKLGRNDESRTDHQTFPSPGPPTTYPTPLWPPLPPWSPLPPLLSSPQESLPFSREPWILSRVFLMRSAVSRADGFWYQHSFISFTSADSVLRDRGRDYR